MLKPGGILAICLPEERHAAMAGPELRLEESHPVRVHGSLTRHFMEALAPGEMLWLRYPDPADPTWPEQAERRALDSRDSLA